MPQDLGRHRDGGAELYSSADGQANRTDETECHRHSHEDACTIQPAQAEYAACSHHANGANSPCAVERAFGGPATRLTEPVVRSRLEGTKQYKK